MHAPLGRGRREAVELQHCGKTFATGPDLLAEQALLNADHGRKRCGHPSLPAHRETERLACRATNDVGRSREGYQLLRSLVFLLETHTWGASQMVGVVGDGINPIVEALRKRPNKIALIGARSGTRHVTCLQDRVRRCRRLLAWMASTA